ncbi:EscU/YscU/HrcU family type III secretion system export apparatus switch protein [Bacillus sp. FJAT-49705]|uniref:EscU/YscU/HrcU family type III secretion system export apparatus switch protein n=2 Tax=Cytobacillus citreus TaxID=2833586 RepID=A0ABS5NR17_9BACI|nr:EscU/YscU/HrcU family type III secretion system export apparatus switch protein [Cytobacillus citreus]
MPKQRISPSKANNGYDFEDKTDPIELANYSDRFAQKMIAAAQKSNIPIQEDSTLLKHLIEVDLGDSVPPQLYALIAEILNLMEEIEKPYLQIKDINK